MEHYINVMYAIILTLVLFVMFFGVCFMCYLGIGDLIELLKDKIKTRKYLKFLKKKAKEYGRDEVDKNRDDGNVRRV